MCCVINPNERWESLSVFWKGFCSSRQSSPLQLPKTNQQRPLACCAGPKYAKEHRKWSSCCMLRVEDKIILLEDICFHRLTGCKITSHHVIYLVERSSPSAVFTVCATGTLSLAGLVLYLGPYSACSLPTGGRLGGELQMRFQDSIQSCKGWRGKKPLPTKSVSVCVVMWTGDAPWWEVGDLLCTSFPGSVYILGIQSNWSSSINS